MSFFSREAWPAVSKCVATNTRAPPQLLTAHLARGAAQALRPARQRGEGRSRCGRLARGRPCGVKGCGHVRGA